MSLRIAWGGLGFWAKIALELTFEHLGIASSYAIHGSFPFSLFSLALILKPLTPITLTSVRTNVYGFLPSLPFHCEEPAKSKFKSTLGLWARIYFAGYSCWGCFAGTYSTRASLPRLYAWEFQLLHWVLLQFLCAVRLHEWFIMRRCVRSFSFKCRLLFSRPFLAFRLCRSSKLSHRYWVKASTWQMAGMFVCTTLGITFTYRRQC